MTVSTSQTNDLGTICGWYTNDHLGQQDLSNLAATYHKFKILDETHKNHILKMGKFPNVSNQVAVLNKVNIESKEHLSELWGLVSLIRVTSLAAWNLYQLVDMKYVDHSEVLLNQYKKNIAETRNTMEQTLLPDDFPILVNCMYKRDATIKLCDRIQNFTQSVKADHSVSNAESIIAKNSLLKEKIGEIIKNCLGPIKCDLVFNDTLVALGAFDINCSELRQQIDSKVERFL